MRFDSIPLKSRLFLDANIFIYHFTGLSEECSQLLERCENEQILGVSSANILAEVLHRLMMIEAVNKGLITPGNVAKKLKKNPEAVKKLGDSYSNTFLIPEMKIKVSPITLEIIKKSKKYAGQNGLMVNDSLVLAVMEKEGVKNLATSDGDFKSVKGIKVFSPQDI